MTKTGRITVSAVKALAPHELLRDSDVKGFVARRQAGDTVSFLLITRIKGRSVKYTIGKLGSPWTVDSARKEARRLLVAIEAGLDIQTDRNATRELLTLKEVAQAFLKDHCGVDESSLGYVDASDPKALTRKGNRRKLPFKRKPGTFDVKESTAMGYRDALMDHVIPRLGTRRIDSVTAKDFEGLRKALMESPARANFILGTASTMISWAMSEAVRLWPKALNPVEGVTRFKEKRRDKALTPDEIKRVFAAITEAEQGVSIERVPLYKKRRDDQAERDAAKRRATGIKPRPLRRSPPTRLVIATIDRYAADALRFLVMSGLRPEEALSLKRADVNTVTSSVHLSDTKTGARDASLSSHAMELLASVPEVEGNPYVFVGAKEGRPLASLQHAFDLVRELAQLPNGVVLYTMRHNFGSTLADAGIQAYDLMKMMGHKHLL